MFKKPSNMSSKELWDQIMNSAGEGGKTQEKQSNGYSFGFFIAVALLGIVLWVAILPIHRFPFYYGPLGGFIIFLTGKIFFISARIFLEKLVRGFVKYLDSRFERAEKNADLDKEGDYFG